MFVQIRGVPEEQAVLQNPKFVTEQQNVLVNEGDNIRYLSSSSFPILFLLLHHHHHHDVNDQALTPSVMFQTALHSGQTGRICDAVEKGERHHHRC